MLGERLPWTLLLVGTSLALATAVGMLAGVHSGWRRGRPVDRWLLGLFLALDNFPRHQGIYFTSEWLWWVLPAGLAITLAAAGLAFLGVGLEPRANPRWRRA